MSKWTKDTSKTGGKGTHWIRTVEFNDGLRRTFFHHDYDDQHPPEDWVGIPDAEEGVPDDGFDPDMDLTSSMEWEMGLRDYPEHDPNDQTCAEMHQFVQCGYSEEYA